MPKLNEYRSYVDHELKDGDPARIQCIYERAIKDNCLDASLWKDYTEYLVSLSFLSLLFILFIMYYLVFLSSMYTSLLFGILRTDCGMNLRLEQE